jgi:hypothetical protein
MAKLDSSSWNRLMMLEKNGPKTAFDPKRWKE